MSTLREAAQQALEAFGSTNLAMHVAASDALRAALAEQKCPCGDRPAEQCLGEWEPGCDMGSNPKHAKVADPAPQQEVPSVASKAVLAAIRAANFQLVRTGDDAFMLVTLKHPAPKQEVQEPLSDERIKDLLGFGDPTEQEKHLIRMGFNAARKEGK